MANIKGTKRNNLTFEVKKKMVNDHFKHGLTFSQLSKKLEESEAKVEELETELRKSKKEQKKLEEKLQAKQKEK